MSQGVSIVPTNRWYIERTVWLIAGFVLILGTLLATLVDTRWGPVDHRHRAASTTVALTGHGAASRPLPNCLNRRGREGSPTRPCHR